MGDATWQQIWKRTSQKAYWLRKAQQYGIPTEGREEQAAKDAEARYRRELRARKAGRDEGQRLRNRRSRYLERIIARFDRQKEKGVNKYGQILEDNNRPAIEAVEYLAEELTDALMYLEELKEKLSRDRRE